MKTLNQAVKEYNRQLQQGDIQTAYKGILDFIGKMRAHFIKKNELYDVGSIYQGYMDMTYFSFVSEPLKKKRLKIAIVYLHEKGAFEVWLSARNRDLAKQYKAVFDSMILEQSAFFHDEDNLDAIIECTLTATPNFDHQDLLIGIIERGVERFVTSIDGQLCA